MSGEDREKKIELKAIADVLYDVIRRMNRLCLSDEAVYEIKTVKNYLIDKADEIK